jgi:IclR family transcriptional regulator, acetate operon repressor
MRRSGGGEEGHSLAARVFLVLESCAASPRPLSLVDLVERTGLPKTTLHRLCWKLVELGMLEHVGGGFRVGRKLFALGSMNTELRRLRAVAMPHLHSLTACTGWATNLAVLSDRRALIVEEVYGASVREMRRMVGVRLPLHATAVGKALLAGFDDDELDELLGDTLLRPFTRTTIARPTVLREQLDDIRRTGVAYSHEEWAIGTSGVASPVVAAGEVVAAVAVVGPPGAAGMRRCAEPVRVAARAVGHALRPQPTFAAA